MIRFFQRFIEEQQWDDDINPWWDFVTIVVVVVSIIGAIIVFGPTAIHVLTGR